MSGQRSFTASEAEEVVDDNSSDISDDINFDVGNSDGYTPVSARQRRRIPRLKDLQPVLGTVEESPEDEIGSSSTYADLISEENRNGEHLVSTPFDLLRLRSDHDVRPPSLRAPSAAKLSRNRARTPQHNNFQQRQSHLTMRWKHFLYTISYVRCFIALRSLQSKYEKSFNDNLEDDPDSGDVFGATLHKDVRWCITHPSRNLTIHTGRFDCH